MTRFHKFTLLAPVLLFILGCETNFAVKDSGSSTPASISAKDEYNFGIHNKNSSAKIEIANIGSDPLTVKAIKSGSMLFPITDASKCTSEAIKGASLCSFTFQFAPYADSKKTGMHNSDITISSSDIKKPTVKVKVTGYSEGKWTIVAPTITTAIPDARYGHSMVTAGLDLYVFGGTDGSSYFGDLWQLNDGTSNWKKIDVKSTENPPERAYTSMVNIGGLFYIFGGKAKNEINLNDLWQYSSSTYKWSKIASSSSVVPEAEKTSLSRAVAVGKSIYFIAPGTGTDTVKVYSINTASSSPSWIEQVVFNAPKLQGKLKANTVIGSDIYIFGVSSAGEEFWKLNTETNNFQKVTLATNAKLPNTGGNDFSAIRAGNIFVLFIDSAEKAEMWSYTVDYGFTKAANTDWYGDESGYPDLIDYAVSYCNNYIHRFGGLYKKSGSTKATNKYLVNK